MSFLLLENRNYFQKLVAADSAAVDIDKPYGGKPSGKKATYPYARDPHSV